jgi:hypothetical protein
MGEANRREVVAGRERKARRPAMAWLKVAILMAISGLLWPPVILAQANDVDQATSQALTSYLKQNHLPLVGAQVIKANGGQERVVLYGFVATDDGKQDAERKAIAYLGTPVPTIDDRLVVKPELATMTAPQSQDQNSEAQGAAAPNAPAPVAQSQQNAAPAGVSFDQLYQQIQQYGIKNPPGE